MEAYAFLAEYEGSKNSYKFEETRVAHCVHLIREENFRTFVDVDIYALLRNINANETFRRQHV